MAKSFELDKSKAIEEFNQDEVLRKKLVTEIKEILYEIEETRPDLLDELAGEIVPENWEESPTH